MQGSILYTAEVINRAFSTRNTFCVSTLCQLSLVTDRCLLFTRSSVYVNVWVAPKFDQIGSKSDNLGLFKISFSTCTAKMILKSPKFVSFGTTSDIPLCLLTCAWEISISRSCESTSL